jgi:hypothetical protein
MRLRLPHLLALGAPAPQAPGNPPAPSPSPLAGGAGAYPGFMLMLSADLDPLSGAPTPAPAPINTAPTPGTPLPQTRPLTIGAADARLRGATASLPLVCRLTTLCTGTLVLQDRKPAGAAATGKARTPRRLGSAPFSIAAGRKKTVKVKLNATGKRLARHKRRLTAYALATVGVQTVTTKVTLEAPRK